MYWTVKCGSQEYDFCGDLIAKLATVGMVTLTKKRGTAEVRGAQVVLASDVTSITPATRWALGNECDEHGKHCP